MDTVFFLFSFNFRPSFSLIPLTMVCFFLNVLFFLKLFIYILVTLCVRAPIEILRIQISASIPHDVVQAPIRAEVPPILPIRIHTSFVFQGYILVLIKYNSIERSTFGCMRITKIGRARFGAYRFFTHKREPRHRELEIAA